MVLINITIDFMVQKSFSYSLQMLHYIVSDIISVYQYGWPKPQGFH